MKKLIISLLMLMITAENFAKDRDVTLYWAHTSDVHGSIFSYDMLRNHPTRGGLPSEYSYIQHLRTKYPSQVVVTDGGDALQGQPVAYYYNFIKSDQPHIIAQAMNEVEYDAGTIGNHDIETGHDVYDRWVKECRHTVLGANVIDESTGKPYLTPYIIIERQGLKIAILGLTSPGIPNWLPKILWKGLYFENMVTSAKKWVKHIKENEKPDLIVGLFHSGFDGGMVFPDYRENATEQVAREVPGFDLICFGHDHNPRVERVVNVQGDTVVCMGVQDAGARLAVAKIKVKVRDGKVVRRWVNAESVLMAGSQTPDAMAFEALFTDERRELGNWIKQPIGHITETLMERDAFFGPSLFMSLIHSMQLEISSADISFAAPISFDSRINAGELTVRDMFALYKYENFLYTIEMSGKEIHDYLEMDYGLWTNQMMSADDHVLLLDIDNPNPRKHGLTNLSYNMDSAAGIDYEVDVTKPIGQRVRILSMSDGQPFDETKKYRVAVNSYRGNGGGELMTKGAGISREELPKRLIESTDKDLRFYLMMQIINKDTISPVLIDNWRFVPEKWTRPALERDRKSIFGEE